MVYLLIKLTKNDSEDRHVVKASDVILARRLEIIEYAISQFHRVLIKESNFSIWVNLSGVKLLQYLLSVAREERKLPQSLQLCLVELRKVKVFVWVPDGVSFCKHAMHDVLVVHYMPLINYYYKYYNLLACLFA